MYQLAIARSVYKGDKDINEVQRSGKNIDSELKYCNSSLVLTLFVL